MSSIAVTTVDELRTQRDELSLRVAGLHGRQTAVVEEIDRASDEVKRGNIPGSVRLNALAVEKNEIDGKLAIARKELAAINAEVRHAAEQKRAAEFREAVAHAKELQGTPITRRVAKTDEPQDRRTEEHLPDL
jgi:hypothetical protein